MMGELVHYSLTLIVLHLWLLTVTAQTQPSLDTTTKREALEIGIGIGIGVGSGCGCPPSPPPGPQPPDFPDRRLYEAYLVIQRFKKTITSDPKGVTNTWNGTNVCGYQGFFCSNPPDNLTAITVASVDFAGFGLGAPTTVGFLDKLLDQALFHVNSNDFCGTIPDLSGLRYLYEIDVSNNRMSGEFPSNVLAVSQLLFLDIRYNAFTGMVPGGVFGLDLDLLFLNNNNFDHPLPTNLGSSLVAYLTLANNGFTGPIPSSLYNASDTVLEVLFLGNQLSGCIPYEIGLLRQATVFDVGNNRLTGPIPYSFGCMAKMEEFNMAGNQMYGHIPEVVCELANLANLSLSDNYFNGWLGPACWKLWRKGILDVRKNCKPGLPMQSHRGSALPSLPSPGTAFPFLLTTSYRARSFPARMVLAVAAMAALLVVVGALSLLNLPRAREVLQRLLLLTLPFTSIDQSDRSPLLSSLPPPGVDLN